VSQVDLCQAAIELPEPHARVVDVFMAGPTDRIEDADSCQKCHRLAGGGEQLFNGFLMVAGLAEHLVIEYRELIGANDECLAGIDGHGFCFFPRQVTREFLRPKSFFIAFIDPGRDRFILIEKTIEQAPPVL
jgi:hypothetical protein